MTPDLDPLARAILDALPAQTAVVDAGGVVVAVNAAWARYAAEQPTARARPAVGANVATTDPLATTSGDKDAALAAGVRAVLDRRQRSFHLEIVEEVNRRERWFALTVTALDAAGGGALVSYTEITTRKRAEAQLAHQALHDPLTGLPNRTLFLDRLGLALARLPRRPTKLAVLFLDLDGFKEVNDSLGHSAGDRAIVAVAERIRSILRPSDTAARLGGDEFTILCEDITDAAQAVAIAERVIAAVSAPLGIDGRVVDLATSVGVAVTDRRGEATAPTLLADADSAMYEAKQRGRSRWHLAHSA